MPIYKNNKCLALTYGNKWIKRVYKGNTLVYERNSDPVTVTPSGKFIEYKVPYGITSLKIDMSGASSGANGGRVQCDLKVNGGSTLWLYVGQTMGANAETPTYNASDIRTDISDDVTGNVSLRSRIIVAGGGGANGHNYFNGNGGAGGGLTGESATLIYAGTAYGGSQTAGGSGYSNGTLGLGGKGFPSYGGAGGAGYYGGGGGNGIYMSRSGVYACGGGGGSSYTHPTLCTNVVHTQGYNNGNGYIKITPISK